MTRFARAKGSKSSNEKKPEEATPWSEMKKIVSSKSVKIPEKISIKVEANVSKSNSTEWASLGGDKTDTSCLLQRCLGKKNKTSEESGANTTKKSIKKKTPASNSCIFKKKINSNSGVGNKIKKKGIKKKMFDLESNPSFDLNSTANGNNKINKKGKKRKSCDLDINNLEGSSINKKAKKEMSSVNDSSSNNINNNNNKIKKEKKQKNLQNKLKKGSICNENSKKNKKLNKLKKSQNLHGGKEEKSKKIMNKKAQNKFSHPSKELVNKNKFGGKNFKDSSVVDEIIVNGEKVQIVKYQGFNVRLEDAEMLKKLRTELIKEGIPREKLEAAIKLERRRAEKALARLKKAVCFNCRGSGHVLSNCPNLTESENTSTGVCYKCGSTEHSAIKCKVVKGASYQFAECFICKEQGHIARQCPDNPRGLYPQGGACRVCGDVTHLKKDCPQNQLKKSEEVVTVGLRNDRDLECLDEEIANNQKNNSGTYLKKKSTVKF